MDNNAEMRAFIKEHAHKSPFWNKMSYYTGWTIERVIDDRDDRELPYMVNVIEQETGVLFNQDSRTLKNMNVK